LQAKKFNVITSLYAFLKIKEVSGITYIPESKLWVIEDSGNANKMGWLGRLEKASLSRML
jgi:hypothetical protein